MCSILHISVRSEIQYFVVVFLFFLRSVIVLLSFVIGKMKEILVVYLMLVASQKCVVHCCAVS